MSTITKEFTKERLEEIAEDGFLKHGESKALARIALASLEAEKTILYRERNPYNCLTTGWQELTDDEYEFIKDNAGENAEFRTVFTAPPSTVSVPDELTREEYKRRFMEDDDFDDTFRGGWNACRAAMLQGAEPVSNRDELPDGWVACSERMPDEAGDIIVVSDGIVMSGVSYSRKKGFYLQALEYDADEPVDDVTHWMTLPAAPQQE